MDPSLVQEGITTTTTTTTTFATTTTTTTTLLQLLDIVVIVVVKTAVTGVHQTLLFKMIQTHILESVKKFRANYFRPFLSRVG